MASYVSARFENTELPVTEQVRVVVRSLDHGPVPPPPSSIYFPTHPDNLRPFIVGEFVSRAAGENYVRVASLADLDTLPELPLDTLEDNTADFVAAGVSAGDLIEITLSTPEVWTSEEYPGTNPFTFQVGAVLNATQVQLTRGMPAFTTALVWEFPVHSTRGVAGVTLRQTAPPNSTVFLEKRFNKYFFDAANATAFISATKTDLDALASASTGESLASENYTAGSKS